MTAVTGGCILVSWTARQINAAQRAADAADADFGFATADVERAVRAAMPNATEREIHDRRLQEV